MFRFTGSRRGAILTLACIASSVVVLAAAVLSIHRVSDVAVLVTFAGVVVAAMTGVEAYWAGRGHAAR